MDEPFSPESLPITRAIELAVLAARLEHEARNTSNSDTSYSLRIQADISRRIASILLGDLRD